MKTNRSLPTVICLAIGLLSARSALAHEGHAKHGADVAYSGNGQLARVDEKTDAAWLAKARADYPMATCAVSGDQLDGGEMGKPQEYVYQEPGKPDQLVRFCCKDCVKDFNKEPAKYLQTIHEARETKEKSGK